MTTQSNIQISVIIKALNEEKNIATTIQSAIDAISGLNGEIILADSHSVDRTIEIALGYPVRIVQLENPEERCCGIGGQLGFQHAKGDFIWIVDGDMQLNKDFLVHALHYLNENKNTAGIGGKVEERNLESLEFRARVQRAPKNLQPGLVDRLDGGGVYRRSAIDSAGYFTNRNLHSYEEYELAIRLRSMGWELRRIDLVSVSHFGHKTEAYRLLGKRWRSGYAFGIGELLRSALRERYFYKIIVEVSEIRVYGLVIVWWLALASILTLGITYDAPTIKYLVALLTLPLIAMSIKKRSFSTGLYSVFSWNVYALGLIRGMLKRQNKPQASVASRILKD